MNLCLFISLRTLVNGLNTSSNSPEITLPIQNLLHITPKPEAIYGLSLLRDAIGLYEKEKGIEPEQSKQLIPFFRENRRMLVGPEIDMYALSFYESEREPLHLPETAGPMLKLTFDYPSLVEYCLSKNYYLQRCKYNEEESLGMFVQRLEREYDKFFYDEEYTGFAFDSQFFNLLLDACVKVQEPSLAVEEEWKLVMLHNPADVEYGFVGDIFTPFVSTPFPIHMIRQIELLNRNEYQRDYSALAGFLESKGLTPETILEGLIES